MNKRGMFYTITAILLVGLAITAFLLLKGSSTTGQAIQSRIYTLDNFLKDVERDMDRALYIATFRSITGFVDEIAGTGVYVDDVDARITNAVLDATYKNGTLAIVQNATLRDWRDRAQAQADNLGIELNITFGGVSISHNTPWSVVAKANSTISVVDKSDLASFIVDYTSNAEVGVLGFEDPLYIVNSLGKITNNITQTIYVFSGNGDEDNEIEEEELLDHSKKGYYIAHSDAPNYLMRLEGDLGPSSNGIESLVYLQKFLDNDLSIKQRTIVDYLYFGNQSVTDCWIDDMPSWFRIDYPHHNTYAIEADEGECELAD